MRFCPLCLEKDIETYGEAYWHRTHQVPSVFICYTHDIVLHDSLVSLEKVGIHYFAADPENCVINKQKNYYTEQCLQQLLNIATTTYEIINCNFSFKGLAWLRNQYMSYLIKQEFMTLLPGGKFIFKEKHFSDSILDFYGYDCLEEVCPGLINNPIPFCSNCLLSCDVGQVIDRTTHILIIRFLASSIEEFFK